MQHSTVMCLADVSGHTQQLAQVTFPLTFPQWNTLTAHFLMNA